jgi:lysozyme
MSRFDAGLLARALAWARPQQDEPEPVSALDVACALARRFEGLFLTPYLCPAGVPTIGYGATHYADGRRVKLTDPPISRDAAERLLLLQVRREYLPAVLRLCPGIADANRLAALIDFTFNLGAGNLAASTLRKRVNAGDWTAVPAELRKWNKGGGRVLRGLVLRREAEAALI